MVMPPTVAKGARTTVFVQLATSASAATEATEVFEDARGAKRHSKNEGMQLELPALGEGEREWEIDVILSAADFRVGSGGDFRKIRMPPDGPSTMARFELVLERVPASGETAVEAFLFHEGAFMGHIGRTVKAVEELGAPEPATTDVAEGAAVVKSGGTSHEVHLIALDGKRALVVVAEPGKLLAHSLVDFDSEALPGFLSPKFGAIRSRGLEAFDDAGASDPVGMGMVRGLGTQLWELCPPEIRTHLLRIYQGRDVDSLRVYTNIPGFPWELMRPVADDGTKLAALGRRFRLGRWHLRMGQQRGLTVPPERVEYRELVAMMPSYDGAEALPALQRELAALQGVSGFRQLPGLSASVASVVADPPNGVIHFAGHGTAESSAGASTRYALRLNDGPFDSTAFVGLENNRLRQRQTLVFFNACELGQADAQASIVEGWAPAVLDAGASGYIGALWPVGDDEAAAFAEAFYAEVEKSIQAQGEARVTEILRCLRRRGAEREDPTWSAYVFYGDPDTILFRTGAGAGGRYTCE